MDEGPAQTPACGRENGEAGEEQQDGAEEGDLPPLRSLGWSKIRQDGALDGGHRNCAQIPPNTAYNPTQGRVHNSLGRAGKAHLSDVQWIGKENGTPEMFVKRVHKELRGNALGLRAKCVSLASRGKGNPEAPGQPLDPVTSFTMDPMKRRPRTMVVTISKLKSIRWKFCQGQRPGSHGPLLDTEAFLVPTVSPCPVLSTETVPIL